MSLRTAFARNSLCALKVQRTKAGGNIEFVRYRKPRFEPRAASKYYRVPERKPVDPEEEKVMKVWTNHYNTAMNSLRCFLKEKELDVINYRTQVEPSKDKQLMLQFNEMTKKNDAFNAMSAQLRLKADKEREDMQTIKNEKMISREMMEKEEMWKEAERRAAFEMDKFDQYVFPANVDSHLERLLNTRDDHNYAISMDGKRQKKQKSLTESDEEIKDQQENKGQEDVEVDPQENK